MQNQCATLLKQGFLTQHAKFKSHLEFSISIWNQCRDYYDWVGRISVWTDWHKEKVPIAKGKSHL